jgi:hypothetical protein
MSSLRCLAGLPGLLTLSSRRGRAWRGHVLDARGALRYRACGSEGSVAAVRGCCRVVLLGGGCQELACDGGVADGGGVVDAEYGGEVQGVGAAGEGFVELAVGAEASAVRRVLRKRCGSLRLRSGAPTRPGGGSCTPRLRPCLPSASFTWTAR